MAAGALWSEKYRPKLLDEIILSDHKKKVIRDWFTTFQDNTNTQCALLFTGPPGLGKTSMAHAILREFGYKPKEFNASDIRSKLLICENLDGLINITDVNKIVNRDAPEIGIIMDEVDGMFKGDRGGIDELLSFISIPSTRKKKANKNLNRRVPVICICNIGNVKKDTIKQLQRECTEISFTLPSSGDLRKVLERVALAEGLTIGEDETASVIAYSQGDFRRLLSILEFVSIVHGRVITMETLGKTYNVLCKKERDLHVTDSVQKLLNESLDGHTIHTIYDADKSKTPMVVHQNYISAVAAMKTTALNKMDCALGCIDNLVTSDLIEKTMYNSQSWYLQPIQGFTCARIPNYYLNMWPKTGIVSASWASVLSVSSQSQNLRKSMYETIYSIPRPVSYTIDDVQHLIETVFRLFLTGQVREAVRLMDSYGMCDREEFSKKKSLAIIDKLAKFIKISPMYQKWVKHRDGNKSDRDLDVTVRTTLGADRTLRTTISRTLNRRPLIKTKPTILRRDGETNERTKVTIKTRAEQEALVRERRPRIVIKPKNIAVQPAITPVPVPKAVHIKLKPKKTI